jgi:CRISPR type II-A-associated protein Csn2
MKLSVFGIENEVDFAKSAIHVIEIENKPLLNSIIYSLNQLTLGYPSHEHIILSERNQILEISKQLFMISDFYNIDFNRTIILKKLYSAIEKECTADYEFKSMIDELGLNINKVMGALIHQFDYEFEMKLEYSVTDLLKFINFKFDEHNYNNIMENILGIVKVFSEFKLYSILVMVNLKCYLEIESLNEFYKSIRYSGINLLLIESNHDIMKRRYERKIWIDEDYDEILFEMNGDDL